MYCPDEYCTNQYYWGEPVMTASSSGFPAYGGQNYTQCQIENTLFDPIAWDYDNDHAIDTLVIPSTTKISIYSKTCVLKGTIITTYPITSRPSLANPDYQVNAVSNTQIYDLIVLTNSTLEAYDSTGLKYSFNYLGNTSTALYGLTCTDNVCWAGKAVGANMTFVTFSMVNGINLAYKKNTTANNRFTSFTSSENGYSQTINGNSFASYCGVLNINPPDAVCHVIDATANVSKTLNIDGGSGTLSIRSYYATFVKMGSLYRYILMLHGTKTGSSNYNIVYDDSFNVLFSQCGYYLSGGCNAGNVNQQFLYSSKPAIVDFDKDGETEYCFFKNDSGINNVNFLCYTNSFVSPKINWTVDLNATGMSQFPDSFYMADFNTSSQYLFIATKEGIFDIAEEKKIYSTGYNYTSATRFTDYPVLSYMDSNLFDSINVVWYGNPAYVFASSTNSFIVFNGVSGGVTCGDLVCDGSENIFTCPVDCLQGATTQGVGLNYKCTANENCSVGLCKYGYCRLADQNEFCDANGDCISGSCNAALAVCVPSTLWQKVNAGKNEQFGDDVNSNNLLSIAIIMVLSVAVGMAVGKYGGGMVAILLSILVFFVGSLFFAIVAWLSWFIVLIELILLIASVVVMVLLGSRTT